MKGIYQDKCNVTSCQKLGATWYNYSTRAYYCPSCASKINYWANHDENYYQVNGHNLCVPEELKKQEV